MKKVVRTVWISLLSGLAFLVACTTPSGLTRAEKKQLKAERAELITQIESQTNTYSDDPRILLEIREQEAALRLRLIEIDNRLGKKVSANEDYDMIRVNGEIDSLHRVCAEMDSINNVINSGKEPEPCVYGPPPVVQEPQSNPLQQLINTKDELLQRYEEIKASVKRREGACVYGSPEVIQKYKKETQRLKKEMDEISEQVKEIDNQIKAMENE